MAPDLNRRKHQNDCEQRQQEGVGNQPKESATNEAANK